MSGARLGVVVNPTSGGGRGAVRGAGVLAALRARGHDVVELTGASRAEAEQRARAAAPDLDALVVVGGDGMAHLGAGVVAGTPLPLGLVAAGSGNDLARALDLPRHDVAGSVAALERGLERGGRRVDAVRSGPPDGPPTGWSVCVVSAGLDAAVSARAARAQATGHELATVHAPGTGRYVRALLDELRAFRPYGYRVTVDGETWEGPASLVAVANSASFGGGMRIAPGARVDDGVLDVVVAGPLSRARVVALFPRLYPGRHVGHPAVTVRQATSVVLEPSDVGALPPTAYADGEPLAALPLRLDVVPGALTVLA